MKNHFKISVDCKNCESPLLSPSQLSWRLAMWFQVVRVVAKFQNMLPIALKALTEARGMEMAYGCRWPYNALCLATINPFRNRFDDRQAHILSELFESLCRLCGEQRVMNSLTTPPSFWFVFQNESSENLESLERRS